MDKQEETDYILECDKCGNKFDLNAEGTHDELGNSLCDYCEENATNNPQDNVPQSGKSVEGIRDKIINDTSVIKSFVWKWLHDVGFCTDDMCMSGLDFDDVFEVMRVYSESRIAELEARIEELEYKLTSSQVKSKTYRDLLVWVNGQFEGDGMENMDIREEVIYEQIAEALKKDSDG